MSDTSQHEHPIEVIVNNKPVSLPSDEDTGAQILQAAGAPPDFQLFKERGQELDPVGPDQQIKVHQHERFRAVSGYEVS